MEKMVKEIAEYAAEAYGFLAPIGEVITGEQFSVLIKSYYDSSDRRHQECANAAKVHIRYIKNLPNCINVCFNE